MYLEIDYDNIGGDYHHSGEKYGDWSESSNIVYRSAKISKNEYGEPIDWEAKVGDVVFLVHVTYGSGDSFGHSSGNSEIIEVLQTAEEAEALANLIEKNYADHPNYFFGKVGDKDNPNYIPYKGRHISTTTWKGYFESLEGVHVIPLPVVR